MTRKQWQQQQTLKYVGYSIKNQSFSWEYVERIGELLIHPITRQVNFYIYFVSGEKLEITYTDWFLDPIYIMKKKIFFTQKVISTNIQNYFNNSVQLKDIKVFRETLVNNFYTFKRSYLKKGLT